MLRQAFANRLKRQAMKAREMRTVSTIRLILGRFMERDVAARGRGNAEGLSDREIQRMLQAMIRQRRESIALFEQGKRDELVQRAGEEIAVIESFLPRQLDEVDIEAAVAALITETGAVSMKDTGRVMAALRERHVGGSSICPSGGGREATPGLTFGAVARMPRLAIFFLPLPAWGDGRNSSLTHQPTERR